jgi:hypothetical protein
MPGLPDLFRQLGHDWEQKTNETMTAFIIYVLGFLWAPLKIAFGLDVGIVLKF